MQDISELFGQFAKASTTEQATEATDLSDIFGSFVKASSCVYHRASRNGEITVRMATSEEREQWKEAKPYAIGISKIRELPRYKQPTIVTCATVKRLAKQSNDYFEFSKLMQQHYGQVILTSKLDEIIVRALRDGLSSELY